MNRDGFNKLFKFDTKIFSTFRVDYHYYFIHFRSTIVFFQLLSLLNECHSQVFDGDDDELSN